jgi:putative FmdB family regulatory protein
MPVYEYKCAKCGEKFDLRRSVFATGNDKAVCPKCGSIDPERVYSTFGTASSSGGSCSNSPIRRFG